MYTSVSYENKSMIDTSLGKDEQKMKKGNGKTIGSFYEETNRNQFHVTTKENK